MNVELRFDYDSRVIYIPDGYVDDVKILQSSFLDWMQEQPECIVCAPDTQVGYSYNEDDFLRYINNVVLKNSNEKAYFVFNQFSTNKNIFVIVF